MLLFYYYYLSFMLLSYYYFYLLLFLFLSIFYAYIFIHIYFNLIHLHLYLLYLHLYLLSGKSMLNFKFKSKHCSLTTGPRGKKRRRQETSSDWSKNCLFLVPSPGIYISKCLRGRGGGAVGEQSIFKNSLCN